MIDGWIWSKDVISNVITNKFHPLRFNILEYPNLKIYQHPGGDLIKRDISFSIWLKWFCWQFGIFCSIQSWVTMWQGTFCGKMEGWRMEINSEGLQGPLCLGQTWVKKNVVGKRFYQSNLLFQAVGDPHVDEDVEESSQEFTLDNDDGSKTTVMRQTKKVTRTVKQTVIQVNWWNQNNSQNKVSRHYLANMHVFI